MRSGPYQFGLAAFMTNVPFSPLFKPAQLIPETSNAEFNVSVLPSTTSILRPSKLVALSAPNLMLCVVLLSVMLSVARNVAVFPAAGFSKIALDRLPSASVEPAASTPSRMSI